MEWKINPNDTKPGIYVSEIEFNDGSKVEDIGTDDIIVFVGANNVGKSQTLKDIYYGLGDEHVSILKNLHALVKGCPQDVINLVKDKGTCFQQTNNNIFYILGKGISITNIPYCMEGDCRQHEVLRDLFVCNIDTEKRLSVCRPADLITRDAIKTHPIHYLAFEPSIRKKFSEYFKRAFHKSIEPNVLFGSQIPLMVTDGKINLAAEDYNDETERVEAYGVELNKYPQAHEQGDGIKGFIGILLYLILDFYRVYLIDEPEAFLHPPQARIMGQLIGELSAGKKQIFISTHSEQMIQGLLDTASDRVKIVRITRNQNINHASVLNAEDIERVWRDPILRYSNILEGLFYKNVVLCESDSDCRFYSIMNDYLQKAQGRYADTFFTYSGGKQRIPVILNALSSLGVETKVITDFDVLNNKIMFEKICKACHIDWDSIQRDYQVFYDAVNRKSKLSMKPKKEILTEIEKITKKGEENDYYTENDVRKIKEMLKGKSYWNILKESGENAIPAGEPIQAFNKINQVAKEHSLFIVPVGELECFVKEISSHGPNWVNDVLEKYSNLNDSVYDKVKAFIGLLNL